MTTFRKALFAAVIKSLVRGKSLIQAILAFWFSPTVVVDSGSNASLAESPIRTIQEFLKEAEVSLLGPVSGDGLAKLSAGLKQQFLHRLKTDPECMIPAYSHQLATGFETGQYLALDVGGSTLRVAVVEFKGRQANGSSHSEIISIRNFSIDRTIKQLEGMEFFDWMAARVAETLTPTLRKVQSPDHPLPLALAWSFPIEQTSLATGTLQGMGKGFMADKGLLGQDLGRIVTRACKNRGLIAEVQAILNDSSACLLSQSYSHPSTRLGLILGTGVNIAAYLPVSVVGRSKFGARPQNWFDDASHVIVNTELGMFGHDILPLTKWDRRLLLTHPKPNFQPLEHLVSGMYLGEVGRLALVDAIETTGIFRGVVPPSLTAPYSLGTDILAAFEGDTTEDLENAREVFVERHPSGVQPTVTDLQAFRSLASFISVRSSAVVATCVYTLWDLRLTTQDAHVASLEQGSSLRSKAETEARLGTTAVAFNGAVIERYPGYLANCQRYIDQLVESKARPELGNIELVAAKESSLLGAAVALACEEYNH